METELITSINIDLCLTTITIILGVKLKTFIC